MTTHEDHPYEHPINKKHEKEETNEKAHENTCTTKEKKKCAESASKEPSKSQMIIKIVVLTIVLILLFGLALCGVLLVSKEKLRLDKIGNESLAIRTEIERELSEVNATWTQKLSEIEVEMKKTFLELEQTFITQQAEQNLAYQKLKSELSHLKTALEANITKHTDDLKTMIRESVLVQETLSKDVNFLMSLHGWHRASNGLYYQIFETRRTYLDARSHCQGLGARLASAGPRDPNVRGELVELMKAKNSGVWIGANDMTQEGTFVWEDGVTANGGDIDWMTGQPDNGRGTEDCVHYLANVWKVNDEQCHTVYMSMCEKEV